MPRKKKPGAPPPKTRSRNGCNPCKARKVKCDERRPHCLNCEQQNSKCNYDRILKWGNEVGPYNSTIPRGKRQSDGDAVLPDFSARQIVFGHSSADRNIPKDPRPPYPVEESPAGPNGPTHRSLPLFKRPNSSDRPSSAGNHQSIPPPPAREPYVPLDPALSREGVAPFLPIPGNGHRYPQSFESYRPAVHEMRICLPEPGPAVSWMRETANEDPSISTPNDHDLRSPSVGTFSNRSTTLNVDSPASTPPLFIGARDDIPDIWSHDRPLKRMRARYGHDAGPSYDLSMPPPNSGSFTPHHPEFLSTSYYNSGSTSNPLTPASDTGDDGYRPYSSRSPHLSQDSPDLRRLSVNSLLSGPPGIPAPTSNPEVRDWSVEYQDTWSDSVIYGIDRGLKDLDIRRNDDMNAISGSSPVTSRDQFEYTVEDDGYAEFGFGMETNNSAFASGSYYDKPVTISIPIFHGVLPSKLKENPMNILYFHHFINHTAGCLVPHNCSSNPFKSILPQMALQDDNLLNLLLAYSALHRARLLRQPEPELRIALWVQDIFPNLRRALDEPDQIITNANLATAIMLASLEIISPRAFGVEVPWQNHLDTARQMIAARGGPQNVQTASRGDTVLSFLWSWFAYLDVLGSLSGVKANSSTLSWVLDVEIDDQDEYQIDCILGFTSKCVRLLARVAELSRMCDSERIDSNHEIIADWEPSQDMVDRAEKLEDELIESRGHPSKSCTHMQSSGEAAFRWDRVEMTATNEAFHWAGLVHLHRRILGKDSTHRDVQTAVTEIFGALNKVRRGSSAEACLLFPMFTAGCDTSDERRRADILERIKGMELVGMTQIHKARALMQRVWETGKPWETLVAGEFFG
ncbi:c6 zinc finger domain containing protein [Drepanopeziza brunnea f. sp. 'multigermtubi' MB_m1]|uniref:C6 zinc finger domain containing protein n=1 Tax=Marssonina brunnea f. sp. multigermtubi (strain MB_m1) TaxID=1072389 RepID=K1XEG2_MARBU|nr:c6 zinc finger domain containing protein [Drepanopeziza brunnea f. sp. 'multigermtubi' MB_m1]EKD19238.1 c6 zinc finger domain containing protein [Drepanopeziza brunnea f. sp. 'multigermtubi' MB_m1]